MGACAAAVIRVHGKRILDMAAFAFGLDTIIQFQAGMIARARMADVTRFRTIGMDCLGIRMAESTGRPVQRHVGDIRCGIQMIRCGTFLDMTHGAIHIGSGRMSSGTAAIIRIDGKCAVNMTAFAFEFGTVIQFQTGVIACTAVAKGAWLRAVHMAGLSIRMTQPTGPPLQGHIGHIRHTVQVIGR